MRSFVLPVLVDRFDRNRDQRDLFCRTGDQDFHLVFIPFSRDLQHKGQFFPVEGAQAGLCIRQPYAVEKSENRGGDPVTAS